MDKIPNDLIAQARVDSPVGELTLGATVRGLAGLWFDMAPIEGVPVDPTQRWIAQASQELDRYWRDAGSRFTVPLDLHGTEFQRAVWHALLGIDSGTTCSYADIAARIGSPRAVRAVGTANGSNPVSIIVPCHRVIGRDGSLTGYGGGLPRKAALLEHESSQMQLA